MEGTESKCRRRRKSAARPFVRSQEEVCDRRTSIDSSCRAATFRNFYEQEKLRPLDARTKVVTHFQEAIIEESTLSSDSEPETTTRFPFPCEPRPSYCIFLVKLFRRSIVRRWYLPSERRKIPNRSLLPFNSFHSFIFDFGAGRLISSSEVLSANISRNFEIEGRDLCFGIVGNA